MATPRRMRFIYGVTAWLLGTILFLTVLDAFAYELFFVISLIGFLIVTLASTHRGAAGAMDLAEGVPQ